MLFTAYHIRRSIDGQLVRDFSDIIKNTDAIAEHELTRVGLDFEAKLYTTETELKKPTWLEFLKDGFERADLPEVQLVGALLLIKVRYYTDQYFAFTFGQGRHILRSKSYDKQYGLRVALNAIYDLENGASTARIKSVESKTTSYNPLRILKQADRRDNFELFETNIFSDQLKAITGSPMAREQWGSRISGSDSVTANTEIAFEDLGDYCRALARTYRETTYQQNFGWIDSLQAVTDPAEIDSLYTEVIRLIRQKSETISLTVPELVSWDEIAYFSLSFEPTTHFSDPEDIVLFDELENEGIGDQLNVSALEDLWKFNAFNNNDELQFSWTLIRCFTGSLIHDSTTYVLSEGYFYQVDRDYEDRLNQYIRLIPTSTIALPDSVGDPPEGEYNELAADSSHHYMLFDKKTVRVSNRTSAIEICDVLTDNGCFVHVKRKLGSSSLSHLFGQGTVSADLYLMNADYRQKCWEVILDTVNGDPSRLNGFSRYRPNGRILPGQFEVVYAIVAKWNGRTAEEALPFFSKVNLRNHAEDLRRMGYKVSMAPVEVV